MARSPIDCGRVRRKTVKLTSPTDGGDVRGDRARRGRDRQWQCQQKAASKWSRLQAAKTKVTRATRQTGERKRERESERKISAQAHLAPLPHCVHVHFIWRPPTLPALLAVCVTSGSKHCEALCDFGCHPLRASMPAAPHLPSPLPSLLRPPTFLPSSRYLR